MGKAKAETHRFQLSDFEVKPETRLNLRKWSTTAGKQSLAKEVADEALAADVQALQAAQERLYASNRFGMLVILQGMDASGKDGAIGHVMRGVNPLGCRAYAFKAPNEQELKHHFLWRPMPYLPERGMISLFNRSYYEEVLVVRVHPKFLEPQCLPGLKLDKAKSLEKLWKQRFREINAFERSLVSNGTIVLKFFLHISPRNKRSVCWRGSATQRRTGNSIHAISRRESCGRSIGMPSKMRSRKRAQNGHPGT